jgi:hypothetical protein
MKVVDDRDRHRRNNSFGASQRESALAMEFIWVATRGILHEVAQSVNRRGLLPLIGAQG